MIAPASDYAGRFIGVRDSATGRFVPDDSLRLAYVGGGCSATTAATLAAEDLAPWQAEILATERGLRADWETTPASFAAASPLEKTTRRTKLAANDSRLRTAVTSNLDPSVRAIYRPGTSGSMMAAATAKGIGAVSAPSVRASRDQLSRMLRRNPGIDRRVTVRFA